MEILRRGYLILQLLIEDVTEMDFEHRIQQTIFEPLSMSRSNYQYMASQKIMQDLMAMKAMLLIFINTQPLVLLA